MTDPWDTAMDLTSAEYAIVGIAMHAPHVLDEVDLSPGDFTSLGVGALYGLLGELASEGVPTDPANVVARLGTLTVAGNTVRFDRSTVLDMYSDAPAAVQAHSYAKIIREQAERRRLMEAGAKIIQLAKEGFDPSEIVEVARGEVDSASRSVAKPWSMGDAYDRFEGQIGEGVTQFPTMWPAVNDVIGGYRPGAVYVLGARPGMGKSIWGVQAALDLSEYGQVVLHSMEMSERELLTRITANIARVNTRRLDGSGGGMRPEDWGAIRQHAPTVRNLPLRIDDRAGVNMNQIRSSVRTASRNGKVSGLVIDYLGLIQGKPWQRSRYEVVTDISRELKILAKDFDIPVIVLAQLNRQAEKDKMPDISHLRDSSAVEQDADVVGLLYEVDGQFGVYLDKNRQGPSDVAVRLIRRGQYSRLESTS